MTTRVSPTPDRSSPSDEPAAPPVAAKPRLRGVSHQVAFFVALVLGPWLILTAGSTTARITAAVYAASLAALFGFSALLHRGSWSAAVHPWMRRLDHSMIFVFIAGTYTPVTALALAKDQARLLLIVVWSGAVAGVAVTLFWINAPRALTAACYVVVGWVAVLALPSLWQALGVGRFALLLGGGLLYTAGAVVYARQRPDPYPAVFGYHEVFHACVIAAVICHFVVIASLTLSPPLPMQ